MNQKQAVLQYLKRHKRGITQLEAVVKLGILRLSERCRELESEGYRIGRETEKKIGAYGHSVRYTRYFMEGV